MTSPRLAAEVVDGGVFFVAADAGIVTADLSSQAGGELPAFFAGSCLPRLRRAGFVSIAVRSIFVIFSKLDAVSRVYSVSLNLQNHASSFLQLH